MIGLFRKRESRLGAPLWRWIGVRMIALALMAILVVSAGMWLRFITWEGQLRAMIPEPVRQEMETLEARPTEEQDRQRLLQIYGEYMYGDYFSDDSLGADLMFFGMSVMLTLPLVFAGGAWMSLRLSRQLGAVAVSADRIAQGDFHSRAEALAHTPAALRSLTDDFNHMAERLERRERELQASSAATAHELRTPLTAAKGRLQGVLDGVFEPTPQNIQLIMRQLDQLNRLIDDLYLLSLISAEQLVLSPHRFSVHSLLEERLAWAVPRLQQLGMSAQLNVEEMLKVRGDRDRIGQVISILLDNAMRYAASGGWVMLKSRPEENGIVIAVEDRGPGFAPEHLERACDRFWRAESSRSRHAGGSGLGLAVAAAIAQAHGGQLTVQNRDEGGARLQLFLPD